MCSSDLSGAIIVGNTQISGSLILDGAQLTALSGIALRVSSDVLGRDGFTCRGELRLDNAEIGGSLRFEGATLDNPDGTALSALDLGVGASAHLCEGFTANGRSAWAPRRSPAGCAWSGPP